MLYRLCRIAIGGPETVRNYLMSAAVKCNAYYDASVCSGEFEMGTVFCISISDSMCIDPNIDVSCISVCTVIREKSDLSIVYLRALIGHDVPVW